MSEPRIRPSLSEVQASLPAVRPTASRAESVRTALLAEAELHRDTRPTGPSRGRWVMAGALVAASAAAVALWVTRAPGESERMPRQVAVVPNAPDAPSADRVRLGDGDVTLGGVDRTVRASAGDVGIDLRGVAHVEVRDNVLVALRMKTGTATIHFASGESKTVFAGERWLAEAAVESAPLFNEPDAKKVPRRRTASPVRVKVSRTKVPPPVVTTAPTAAELAFEDGWAAMKSGRYRVAATEFRRVAIATGNTQLAQTGQYWLGVALARSGQSALARSAMQEFLTRYPRSGRAAKVSVMLGWLLYKAGDRLGARRRFEAASRTGGNSVRASARDGLRALDARP